VATLQIRPDVREHYSSLFGAKTAHGRTLVVEDLIADMTVAISVELQQLLAARYLFQEEVREAPRGMTFCPAPKKSPMPTATAPPPPRSAADCWTDSLDAAPPTPGA
jgi:hypothetical protein